jgi:integrase
VRQGSGKLIWRCRLILISNARKYNTGSSPTGFAHARKPKPSTLGAKRRANPASCAQNWDTCRNHDDPVVMFAYITGWRVKSEILPLEWRQVDLKAGELRLDPGTTKNGERQLS